MNRKFLIKIVLVLLYSNIVFIIVKTVPGINVYFKDVNVCVSDYYLFFYDWSRNPFLCAFEMAAISFVLVLLIKSKLRITQVILYDSMSKLWIKCVETGLWITIVIPLVNLFVILLVSINNACLLCNWNQPGSFAKNMVSYYELCSENTFAVMAVSLILDILRLQTTLFIICIFYWITRAAFFVFAVIYFNIIISNMSPLMAYEGIYVKMSLNQRMVYINGIMPENLGVPFAVWAGTLAASLVVFRYVRKDLLKN